MRVFLTIALRNLLLAWRRSAFLGVAIPAVTLLMVLLLSLSQGIRDNLIFAATALTTGHVNVSGFYKTAQGDASPIVTGAAEARAVVEKHLEGVDFIVDRQNGFGKVVSATSSLQSVFKGIDVSQDTRFLKAVQLAEEREYVKDGRAEVIGSAEDLAKPNSILLFASQAKRLEVQVGDALTLTTQTFRGMTNTAEVTVVAVAKDLGMISSFHVFMPPKTLLDIYQLKENTTGVIMVYLDDIDRANEARAELYKAFEDEGYSMMEYDPRPYFMKFEGVMGEDWRGQRIDITTWEDETSFMSWILTAVDTISFILIAVLTIIIAIGITNTMWIAVRERTRELGTVRAIGMSKRQVLLLFMLEALILGFASTVVGAAIGAGIATGITAAHIAVPIEAMQIILMSETVVLSVNLGHVISAVLVFTLVTALAAAWPAIRASRLQPVTAIHHID